MNNVPGIDDLLTLLLVLISRDDFEECCIRRQSYEGNTIILRLALGLLLVACEELGGGQMKQLNWLLVRNLKLF
jgi:hypothetical protein